jgi:DNA-binding MarR family transcriptional regulator
MTEPTLWDIPADPNYRNDDPPTSVVAGKAVQTNAREAEVLSALRKLICASDTHDVQRVLADYNLTRERNCISRRLTSLERKGMVRRAGVKDGRRTLWALTDAGRAAS